MSKKQLESMENFRYFIKLKKTKKKTATEFFSSFFSSQIPKRSEGRKYKTSLFHYKDLTQETPEEILINELKKPITEPDINLLNLSSKKLNNYLNNSNNHYNMERNINTMVNILTRNKKCLRYFIFNSLSEKYIRLLLSFSEHEFYLKGAPIYKYNSKPNECYLVIRGKVSLRSLNQDKIKNEVIKNNYNFLEMYKKIQVEDKFHGRYIEDDEYDKISVDNFVSKTNIIIKQQDDNNVNIYSLVKNRGKRDFKKNFRRSFTKDYNLFKKELESNQNPKKIVEDKILVQNLIDLQRNLSCEVKVFTPGDFFGEWDLILDKPRPETAYAEENTDLLVLNKKYFDKYFLKQLIKVDNERRLFLTKRIDFLHANNVINLKPEFYNKDEIIYTQFDFAKKFYIIYKGHGALKQINNNNCKKKSDVIFYKDDMKTLCLVDKGCVVGLEACKDGRKKYDNNFIITEDNTILYPIKMRGINDDNYMKKKNRIQLKKELGDLYLAQTDILPKYNNENKILNKEELKYKKNEDRLNNMFQDAKDYHWRTILSQNKIHMKINTLDICNLNEGNKNNQYTNLANWHKFSNKKSSGAINLKKIVSTEFNSFSNKMKSKNRNSVYRYFNSLKKSSKRNSIMSFPDKEDKSKKFLPFQYTNDTFNSHKSETLNLKPNNYSESSYNKKASPYLKSISIDAFIQKTFSQRFKKDKKFLTLKPMNFPRIPDILNEEKNNEEKILQQLKSFGGDSKKESFHSSKNLNKKKFFNIFAEPKKKTKTKLTKIVVDKYITKMAKISNDNNINYNSGYFKIPLIGAKS